MADKRLTADVIEARLKEGLDPFLAPHGWRIFRNDSKVNRYYSKQWYTPDFTKITRSTQWGVSNSDLQKNFPLCVLSRGELFASREFIHNRYEPRAYEATSRGVYELLGVISETCINRTATATRFSRRLVEAGTFAERMARDLGVNTSITSYSGGTLAVHQSTPKSVGLQVMIQHLSEEDVKGLVSAILPYLKSTGVY